MKLAVFDIDGTLTQPYPGEDTAFLEGLERAFGFSHVDVDWNTHPHVTDTGIDYTASDAVMRALSEAVCW